MIVASPQGGEQDSAYGALRRFLPAGPEGPAYICAGP